MTRGALHNTARHPRSLETGSNYRDAQVFSHVWDATAGWILLKESGRAVGRLLPGTPLPFPMVPGTAYEGRVFPLAAGMDEAFLTQLQSAVRVTTSAQPRFDAWAAGGWDLKDPK